MAEGGSSGVIEFALGDGLWEPRTRTPVPTAISSNNAAMMRVHNRPVPNPRRFNLTSASEYSNQVERNEERHTNNAARPGRSRQRACLSSDSSEKISNYLNIWRIAVSSDHALPYPLKPREMRGCIRKDAGGCTKVVTRTCSWEATCRVSRNGLQSCLMATSALPPKTCLFSVSEHCPKPDQIGRAIAHASLPACRVADRFFSPERRINPR